MHSTPASPEDAPGTAPTVLVELKLVEVMFVEGGYGVVAISDRASGDELARAAVQLSDSGSVVLPVIAGELDVRAWTHACDPSGCSELSDAELDRLRPGSDDLCTTSVAVPAPQPGTEEPSQTQLLYQFGVLARDDTRATCRLEVLPQP